MHRFGFIVLALVSFLLLWLSDGSNDALKPIYYAGAVVGIIRLILHLPKFFTINPEAGRWDFVEYDFLIKTFDNFNFMKKWSPYAKGISRVLAKVAFFNLLIMLFFADSHLLLILRLSSLFVFGYAIYYGFVMDVHTISSTIGNELSAEDLAKIAEEKRDEREQMNNQQKASLNRPPENDFFQVD